jgi:DNA polymerase III delta subunit
VPKKEFSDDTIPAFDHAPSVVAVVGDVAFFVAEAAERARGRLAEGDVEVLRFDEEAPPGSVAEALLNRSLFSPRRLVEIDLSRVLGVDSPGDLLERAVDAWARATPAG